MYNPCRLAAASQGLTHVVLSLQRGQSHLALCQYELHNAQAALLWACHVVKMAASVCSTAQP